MKSMESHELEELDRKDKEYQGIISEKKDNIMK
jgi:hypothetical protein